MGDDIDIFLMYSSLRIIFHYYTISEKNLDGFPDHFIFAEIN